MPFAVTRRDCLRFAGGGALGLMLSPVPWKVLDDLAIWSQNMPWVPVPPRGEVTTRHALCTLCTAGCTLRARCVAGVPVALAAGSDARRRSTGLCPLGVAAHHMPYHPARLRQPVRVERSGAGISATPVERAAVVAALAAAVTRARGNGESIVALDPRPGRTVSWLYRQVLATAPGGVVAVPPGAMTDQVPGELTGGAPLSVGIDLERVATLLSFGAPVLDGWTSPGRIEHLRDGDGRRLRIVQVETRPSRTALAADSWLAIRPGSEGAVALGLARLLLAEPGFDSGALAAAAGGSEEAAGLVDVVHRFTPAVVASLSGIPPADLEATAREIARHSPAVAISGVDPGGGPLPPRDAAAVWTLNVVLGALAGGGAIRRRPDLPDPAAAVPLTPVVALDEVPPHSVRVLIVDAAPLETALPWPVLERLLVDDDPLVVALSPYLTGVARHAAFVVPAAAPFEAIDEALAPAGAVRSSWAVAPALLAPPSGATAPAAFLAEFAGAVGLPAPLGDGDLTAALRGRCAALFARGTGVVAGPGKEEITVLADLGSPERLWQAVTGGGVWIDEKGTAPAWPALRPLAGHGPELVALATRGQEPVSGDGHVVKVMPYGWKVAAAREALPPLLTKLYRESGLRPAAPQAAVGPATARACGVAHGRTATLATAAGTMTVEVVVDHAVMPGVVHLASGPDPCCLGEGDGSVVSPVDVCIDADSTTWRVARATLSEA